jgi:hypothetical protein
MKTITISLNTVWQPNEGELLKYLRDTILNFEITAIERAGFSDRYAITIEDNGYPDDSIYRIFKFAFKEKGFSPDIISIESGSESSNPGGLIEGIKTTAKAGSAVFIPIAVIVVVLGAIYFLPRKR